MIKKKSTEITKTNTLKERKENDVFFDRKIENVTEGLVAEYFLQ